MKWLVADTLDKGDDGDFVAIVDRIVGGLAEKLEPLDVYIVRVNNWFDEDWFRFAGKTLGAVGLHSERMIIPPFVPNRVSSEVVFERLDGGYPRSESARRLHINISSDENVRRMIADYSKEGLFVWYSSASKPNARGNLMIYYAGSRGPFDWYIGLKKSDRWRLHVQHGLGRDQAAALVV